jgi:hypothetical protein
MEAACSAETHAPISQNKGQSNPIKNNLLYTLTTVKTKNFTENTGRLLAD